MNVARMQLACLVALGGLLLPGCQPHSTTLNHVSGKVYFRGAPLPGGLIVFTPDTSKGESGKIAIAKILDDGSYTLSTDDVVGATSGWYRVTVAVLSGHSASLDSTAISLIPERYRDPQFSQLQCEVKANRDNQLNFNLD